MNQPTLAQLQAATARAAAHLLEVHGIRTIGSASHIELTHMHAHHREGTDWHYAWTLQDPQHEQAGR